MRYSFDAFTLDLGCGELRKGDIGVSVEPRAFALLSYLVEHRDRLITKDELVETLWDGRVVSDAAVSTVVKSARRAIDDDGTAQKYIRTLHGRRFRFVGEAKTIAGSSYEPSAEVRESTPEPATGTDAGSTGQKPTLAILPFKQIGSSEPYAAIADAVPGELISSLSRLRWLKVIARGSSFRFRDADVDAAAIHASLGANYCLSGDVEVFGRNLAITVELSDTRNDRVVWGERLSGKLDDVHQMRTDIVSLVTSALELHIPLNEAELARLRMPESLDAWSVFHIGLQHMYRFNQTYNEKAASLFERATLLDPNFARAFAARSFTSFQAAFLRYNHDRSTHIENARRFAERSVELDPIDPFGNFNYGRAHWLRGDPAAGQAWLERAISLSPSFAQGIYAHSWASVMGGDGETGLLQVERAIALSPLDPFLYAMQSITGLAYLHVGNLEQAAYWTEQGARKPGAHYLISAISAAVHKIAGHDEKAKYWARNCLTRRPDASIGKFFAAFPFENSTIRESLSDALGQLGFQDSDDKT